MRRRIAVALAGLAGALACAGIAAASFGGAVATAGTVSTGSLAAATGLAASHPNATGAAAGQVNLTWAPSASPSVGGHRVDRASAETGPWTTLATLGAAATSHSDAAAPYNAERYYRVQAFRGSWSADSAILSSHSRPMASGADRVSGSGAGTALTGPWTTTGTQLAALAVADGTRYQPTAWPSAPTTLLAAFYLDATHAWASGTGTVAAYDGTSWVTQNPGVAGNLEGIMFPSATTGWSVGANGVIVKTTNGGTTWTAQASGSAQNLRDVECVSTTACWVVGSNGTILVTTNGGTTWTAQTSGVAQVLREIDCVSATVCWIAGATGTILKTVNGGTTWTAQTSGTSQNLRSISCVDANRCWAVGNNGVVRVTANGGATWTAQTSGTPQTLRSVFMVSATVGWITGDGSEVRKTTDGGATWVAQTVPAAAYQSASCISTSQCMIVSDLGVVLMTGDGGATWAEQVGRYVELTPLTVNLAAGGAVTSVSAKLVYRTTTVPGAGTRVLLSASADAGLNWATFTLTTPGAANTDVTQTVALASLGFAPTSRAQNIRFRYALVPQGGALTAQIDLVHLDVN